MPSGPLISANSAVSASSALTRAEQTNALGDPVSKLASTGRKRLVGLTRLGISTIRDLLCAYPFRYNDLSLIVPIAEASLSERSSILGTVKDVKVKRPRPRLTIIEASVVDESGILIASWFNQPWMLKILSVGTRVILMGKVEHTFGYRRMSAPLHSVLDEETSAGSILPVYRSNSDISQGWVSHCIDEALSLYPALLDPLPAQVRIDHGFISRHAALMNIHHPQDRTSLSEARRRLAFEEILFLQLFFQIRRKKLEAAVTPRTHTIEGNALTKLRSILPFELTADQASATEEILADMANDGMMNRLLLGDVGSGKTIVAAFALAAAHDSGHQAAMMAPTEVLAEQYAQKVGPLFDEAGIPWALLTSSTKDSQRKQYLESLATGTISVMFGTHALIEPDVCFRDLSLTIIDEQHRFGVEQREALRAKGIGSDLLSMTATPIPRSLALTIYGDMDTSYIRMKPRETVRTTTKVINWKEIWIAYDSIRRALAKGEQAYIVCPLICAPSSGSHREVRGEQKGGLPSEQIDEQEDEQGDEQIDVQEDEQEDQIWITEFTQELDESHIQAAEQEVSFLRSKVFPDKNVGLMTSKLKANEKRKVMDDFRNGQIDILVSTTVIEVGIDVPNATVMVIEDADHFGLSQLHQLRGRVGRGKSDAEVFLVTATHREDSLKRLSIMENSSDGFELAEYDLRLRHEGDILGSRQHGAAALKLVNVIHDAELIQSAHKEAQGLLRDDPFLEAPEHGHLLSEIQALFNTELE